MEGNAVVRCEFGHVGDGLRADSGTRFPGASCSFCSLAHVLTDYRLPNLEVRDLTSCTAVIPFSFFFLCDVAGFCRIDVVFVKSVTAFYHLESCKKIVCK
jgi:hypothetical protein